MEVRLIAIVDRSRYYFKRACSVKEIVVLRNGDQAFWFFFSCFYKTLRAGDTGRDCSLVLNGTAVVNF